MRRITFVSVLCTFLVCIWCNLATLANGSLGPMDNKHAPHKKAAAAQAMHNVSEMRSSTFKFWLQHGPDKHHGGFHGTLDRQGNPISPTNKTLVQQARHLWSLSSLLASGKQQEFAAAARAAADNLFSFLRTHMLMEVPLRNKGKGRAFVHQVRQDGAGVENPAINMYANAFAIYGMSKYAQVTGSTEALNLALEALKTLDNLYHNPRTGGYDESNTIGGLVFDSVPLGKMPDDNSTGQQLSQSLNTLFHVAEALTELSRATAGRNSLVQARLLEHIQLLTGKLVIQPDSKTAFLAPNYDPRNWKVVSTDYINYGHNIEAAWLLADSVDQLQSTGTINSKTAAQMKAILQIIGDTAVRLGYDTKYGGFYDGGAATQSTVGNKVFWVQAEGMLGLDWLYRRTGQQQYKEKLLCVLGFVQQNLWDRQYGEWYWQVPREGGQPLKYSAGGVLYDAGVKGNGWKASYHVGRALLKLESKGYRSPSRELCD